jgi:2-oxoisovalerate dehydrogenase E1 component alpha subunit
MRRMGEAVMTQTRRSDTPGESGLSFPEGLTSAGLLDLYATMVLVRTLDERIWAMNRQGKAAIVASSQGHEGAQLAAVWALKQLAPSYTFFTYYRDLAVAIGLGMTPTEALLGYLAKDGEPMSGARQFPQHGAYPERHLVNISNVVGTNASQAVGWALAAKLRGEQTVVAVANGDGAASQGEVHEAMNFASVHKLPVIFIFENNKYAISVPLHRQMVVPHIAIRGAAYGMPAVTVDGTDVLASYEAIADAIGRAGRGDGPSLVEFDVERYLPHTSDDDDTLYRDPAEIEKARKRDPLKVLGELLSGASLLTSERAGELAEIAKATVNAATDAAEAAPFPDDGDVLRYVFEEEG